MITHLKTFNYTACLLAIILFGTLLRIYATFNNRVYGDEILAYERAIDYAAGKREACYLSQANFKRSSKMPGPLWAMFWLNVMRFGASIESVPIFIALLNSAIIPLTYLLALKLFSSKSIAILAALFQATNPWPVYYSVGSYNTLLVGLPAILMLLALWHTVSSQKTYHSFWISFISLVSFQFHGSILPLFFAALILMIVYRKMVNWTAFFLGILAGIPFYWRYILEERSTGWHNTLMMLSGETTKFSFGCFKVFNVPFTMLTNWCHSWFVSLEEYLHFGDQFFFSRLILLTFNAISIFLAILFIYGFIKVVIKVFYKKIELQQNENLKTPFLFLIITILAPLFIFLLSFQDFSSRYTITQLPLLSIVIAVSIIKFISYQPYKSIVYMSVVLVVIFNIILDINFYKYTARTCLPESKSFTPNFEVLEKIYLTLRNDAGHSRHIAINDANVLAEQRKHNAQLITIYIRARQKEDILGGLIGSTFRTNTYLVMFSNKLGQDDLSRVLYKHSDIVILRSN